MADGAEVEERGFNGEHEREYRSSKHGKDVDEDNGSRGGGDGGGGDEPHHENDRHRDGEDGRDRGDKDRERSRHRDDPDRERHRERDSDRDRERHRERDGDRDRHRDRGERRDRDRDRDSRRRHTRSRTRSRSPRARRSRSKDRERGERRRRTGFDQPPPGGFPAGYVAPAPVALPQAAPPPVPQAPVPMPTHVPMPNPVLPMMGNPQQPGMGAVAPPQQQMQFPQFAFAAPQMTMPPQAYTQQATRHARRVYVGGLPTGANEQNVARFFSAALHAIGGATAGPGDCVVNVYINNEKKFAFVEYRTVEETSNAMALDGIVFDGVSVRVRRPNDYNPAMAATLGPSQPMPGLQVASVGLIPGASAGADGPDRIFVGGLPYYLTEDQIKELLSSFGQLRAFELVKDRETGNSKGYGFAVYQDSAVVDIACAGLNGMKMGDKTLTVRRATASGQPKPDQQLVMQQAHQQIAMNMMGILPTMVNMLPGVTISGATPPPPPSNPPTQIISLLDIVTKEELMDDQEYQDIMEDMRDECGKFGTILNILIPRPRTDGVEVPGLGKVFVEYVDVTSATKARASLHGRKFGGRTVIADYINKDEFNQYS